MRILFVGGTGFISTSVSREIIARGHELFLLNRGQRGTNPAGSHSLVADISRADEVRSALGGLKFDVIVDWVAYAPQDIARDLALFTGLTRQYIFISSASIYQKPPAHYIITESTPLHNPYWDYSRNKIACEELLLRAHREQNFPVTIVRPSLTYDPQLPLALGGWGCYTLCDRLKNGRPIIIHGDGSSLWVVTHAEDFARGFIALFGNPAALGHAFHITSDEVLTWNQIYGTIAEALGVEPIIEHIPSDFIVKVSPQHLGGLIGDKTWSAVFDNTKIKTWAPGFQCVIPFREGVRRTLAQFDADERRRRIDPAVNQDMDAILAAWKR
ncbi:MAG TPA: SDR family oxidoreductase [Verrucomicrobiae bacterium]|jgi:nucleoside-diphosphate-sugar epimerase|nr:SDR family oxidoreductase [Verrucomicrobiae bacterium]